MNGCDHYVEAERLLTGDDQEIAAAQVHATLALTAATIDAQLWLTPKHEWSTVIA